MSVRYFNNPYSDVMDPNQPLVVGPTLAVHRAVECLQNCVAHVAPTPRNFDGGLYTGYLGIAWACFTVLRKSGVEISPDAQQFLLAQSHDLIAAALAHAESVTKQSNNKEDRLSMLLGESGVWMTAAMLYHFSLDTKARDRYMKKYADLAPEFKTSQLFPQGSDEFFIGRAGYLAGIAVLRSWTGQSVLPDKDIFDICHAIVESGKQYSRNHYSPCPLMYAYYHTEYLGAGHGLAGILFALMLFPDYLKANPDSEQLVRSALAYMLQITPVDTGNLPSAMDEVSGQHRRPSSDILVHWCHGATGAVLVYARAFVLWKDPRYLLACRQCADVIWKRGLLKKGPGICHGVAGSAYAFLVLYRLTGEVFYLHRASMFAEFMQSDTFKHARRPDCPYSLFEGLAGTACFYADLANPSHAAFPLMDPLWDTTSNQ